MTKRVKCLVVPLEVTAAGHGADGAARRSLGDRIER
jgi:hypothetical protein